MLKKILAVLALLYAAASFAAVDANKASAAELDGVRGIGPAISAKILEERKKGNFKDWNDFIDRVKGIGEGNAAKMSEAGLTVNGAGYKGASAAGASKPAAPASAAAAKDAKKDDKKDTKADAKADAKAKKDAEKKAKEDEKKKQADEAKAKKEADKKAKDDAKKAKDDKAKADKAKAADGAKPAASAAKK